MSKNNGVVWDTKYGRRRVRQEAPTLAEAIVAARDLSDTLEDQVEIAASLMGLPKDKVMSEFLKAAPQRKDVSSLAFTMRAGVQRAVVVERKPSRRIVPPGRAIVTRTAFVSKLG